MCIHTVRLATSALQCAEHMLVQAHPVPFQAICHVITAIPHNMGLSPMSPLTPEHPGHPLHLSVHRLSATDTARHGGWH
jgi:hypothetical protein